MWGNVWRRFQWRSGCFADAEAAPPRRHFYLNAKMCFNRFSIQQARAGSRHQPAAPHQPGLSFILPACIIDDTRASPLQPTPAQPAHSSPASPGRHNQQIRWYQILTIRKQQRQPGPAVMRTRFLLEICYLLFFELLLVQAENSAFEFGIRKISS